MYKKELTSFDKVFPMLVQKYETFLPPTDETIEDKMNSLITYLNRVGKLNNDVVKQWNNVASWTMEDGLKVAVEDKVNVLLENGDLDGIFEDILNETVVSDINNSIDKTKQDIATINTSLSGKAKQVDLDTTNSNISNIAQQKANKVDLDIERSRIDNLAKLPQGSTTGDAELIDMRVGQDGVTYANAGKAVRDQFEKSLKGIKTVVDGSDPYIDFNNVPNNSIIRYTTNAFINAPNVVVSGGTLITVAYNKVTADGGRVQTFYGSGGTVHTRMYWSSKWSTWSDNKELITAGTVVDNTHKYYDANNIDVNGVIRYGNAGLNIPTSTGALFQMWGDKSIQNGKMQIFISSVNELYYRLYWNAWKPWEKMFSTTTYENDKSKILLTSKGRIDSLTIFNDFDNVPPNTVYVVTIDTLANAPANGVFGTLVTLNDAGGTANVNGITQTFTTHNGAVYSRNRWSNKWTEWKRLDNEVTDNPIYTMAMFETIGVIGDSYASGAFGEKAGDSTAIDHYNWSWVQMLARKNGIVATNYTKGGLSTRSWLTDSKGLTALKSDTPKQLYILALIRNDYNIESRGETGYIGVEGDMVSKRDTFYGNYARIIDEIKLHAPNAKIVLMTGDYTSSNTLGTSYNEAVKKIATYFGLPCMVQLDHPYFSTTNYRNNWADGGHPGISQYSGMTKAIESMFSKVIENNVDYFKYIK